MLSTTDNDFNYFTQFEDWYRFDKDYGYNCLERVASVASTSPYFPDEINDMLIDQAIDDIIRLQLPMIGAGGKEVYFYKCYEPSADQLSEKSD